MIKHLKIFILSTTLMFGFVFFGCDNIEGPYGISNGTIPNDTVTDTIIRKVLLEDFTGHTCAACPASHDEAKRLHDIYGKRLIVLGIHAGFFSWPQNAPYQNNFQTATGTTITTDFNLINLPFPKGMVNRLYKPSTSSQYIFDWPDWETTIDTILQRPADAGIDITNSFSSTDSMMTASVDIKMVNDYVNPISLAVYFAEDSIVAPQKNGSVDVLNYIHRHVLRGSFTGAFGETIGTSATAGQELNKTYSTKLTPTNSNVNQVYIYAILFDDVTREVIQVEEKKLIP
jgi:hypothetical protein